MNKLLFSAVSTSVLVLAASVSPAQEIAGTVISKEGKAISGLEVLFLDAMTGTQTATATSTITGAYSSGIIPTGNYRVRFVDSNGAGSPGVYIPEYFGANGDDVFCAGTVVTAVPGSTAVADETLGHRDPAPIVTWSGDVLGHVTASEDGTALGGMTVTMLNARNAEEVVTTITRTDKDPGLFEARIDQSSARWLAIRASDPASQYFPEYYGPGGTDDFCAAENVDLEGGGVKNIDFALTLIPKGQVVDDLRDAIDELDISDSVGRMLDQPLTQAVAFLTDDNVNNDDSVCGQLRSFISRVEIQVTRGQISPADAVELIEAAELTLVSLGC